MAFSYRSNASAADETVAGVAKLGRRALAVQADVSVPDDAGRLVEAVTGAFGRIDILVNNAGITSDHLIAFMGVDDWTRVLEHESVRGRCTSPGPPWPAMSGRSRGRIVNITQRGRPARQRQPGQLLGVQGRADRADPVGRPGSRQRRHHVQRGGAGPGRRPI